MNERLNLTRARMSTYGFDTLANGLFTPQHPRKSITPEDEPAFTYRSRQVYAPLGDFYLSITETADMPAGKADASLEMSWPTRPLTPVFLGAMTLQSDGLGGYAPIPLHELRNNGHISEQRPSRRSLSILYLNQLQRHETSGLDIEVYDAGIGTEVRYSVIDNGEFLAQSVDERASVLDYKVSLAGGNPWPSNDDVLYGIMRLGEHWR